MESMYAKKQISGRDIYNLVKSIKKLADNMREYLIDINNILFGMEFVYVKRQEKKYRFCYYPEKQKNYQESLRDFFDKMLEYINHNDRAAVLIAYGIQQITISEDFTIQDLMDCAEKNIKISEPDYHLPHNNSNYDNHMESSLMEEKEEKPQRKEKKNLLQSILAMFQGKSRYKGEEELLYVKEESSYGENTENIPEEMEDATMILTAAGAIETITLRSLNTEEEMEITPVKLPCVLGKSKKSSDFYLDSPVVSRVHMRISEDMATYFVEDLNSTNGTFVNGIQLVPYELKEIKSGDQITLANMDFIVE
jgi:hypothetical protein